MFVTKERDVKEAIINLVIPIMRSHGCDPGIMLFDEWFRLQSPQWVPLRSTWNLSREPEPVEEMEVIVDAHIATTTELRRVISDLTGAGLTVHSGKILAEFIAIPRRLNWQFDGLFPGPLVGKAEFILVFFRRTDVNESASSSVRNFVDEIRTLTNAVSGAIYNACERLEQREGRAIAASFYDRTKQFRDMIETLSIDIDRELKSLGLTDET